METGKNEEIKGNPNYKSNRAPFRIIKIFVYFIIIDIILIIIALIIYQRWLNAEDKKSFASIEKILSHEDYELFQKLKNQFIIFCHYTGDESNKPPRQKLVQILYDIVNERQRLINNYPHLQYKIEWVCKDKNLAKGKKIKQFAFYLEPLKGPFPDFFKPIFERNE